MFLPIALQLLLVGVLVSGAEKECEDLASICDQLISYCQSDEFATWMEVHCRASCGLCVVSPTTQPPPPAPKVVTSKRRKVIVPKATDGPSIVSGTCGVQRIKGTRVIGGVDAVPGSWPWQILMLFNGYSMCGGALISPQWVLSAAHCVYGYQDYPNEFVIRTGEHNRDEIEGQEQEYIVEKILIHPDYDPIKLNNDIALLKLKRPALFSKYVEPVCLPDTPPDEGDNCYITGWGKTDAHGHMTNILQQGKLAIVSKERCHELNMKNIQIPVTDAMICAGSGGKSTLSGCHGDSGGPFVCEVKGKWYLQGAVSHGSPRCNSTETYTVFARVTYFRDWIDGTMMKE